MKKIFQFEEKIVKSHCIEVEIDIDKESEYEDFADKMAEDVDGMDVMEMYPDDIAEIFYKKFGREKVTFDEGDIDSGEYEVI